MAKFKEPGAISIVHPRSVRIIQDGTVGSLGLEMGGRVQEQVWLVTLQSTLVFFLPISYHGIIVPIRIPKHHSNRRGP